MSQVTSQWFSDRILLCFGMMVYGENYYLGFVFPQLFQSRIKVTTLFNTDDNSNARHYYFTGQYVLALNDEFELIPSTFVKLIGASPTQVDLTARVRYNQSFWTGITMRPKDAVVFLAGLDYNNFVPYFLTDRNTQTTHKQRNGYS